MESNTNTQDAGTAAKGRVQRLPHHYAVTATGNVSGDVRLENEHLPVLISAAPAAFGGPGDRWSPEELCVGAVADCFVLTFRAVASASRLSWSGLQCAAEGTLDRVDGVTRFSSFALRATLRVPEGTDEALARKMLERAKQTCLITQSLKAACELEAVIETGA